MRSRMARVGGAPAVRRRGRTGGGPGPDFRLAVFTFHVAEERTMKKFLTLLLAAGMQIGRAHV